ncbi:MAG TPA: hypothetical protein VMY88_10750, partial [Acidimicrobiales bacterium]|nr:hypothetical protein [Acidimicrobiales bacterium]
MRNSKGKTSARTVRVMGLILVLGMPLAVASPLVRAPQAGNPGSELASSAPEPMASVEETLEGYEAA